MSGVSNELDVGVESDRMSQTSARHGIASSRSDLGEKVCAHCRLDLVRLRPDDFYEPHITDPYDGWCGEGRRKPFLTRINPAVYCILHGCLSKTTGAHWESQRQLRDNASRLGQTSNGQLFSDVRRDDGDHFLTTHNFCLQGLG